MASTQEEHAVLPKKFGGGPHGLGDPEDRTLRKVEIEVLIPKKMRDKAKAEKCVDEVKGKNGITKWGLHAPGPNVRTRRSDAESN
ncbi:uncharacterized protein [Anabrus simplex]|uniref:uncharacterized protein isoform X2 n=1 Tax=Anabrus simplex TaxID=316456 RepID=UPI0035A29B16